MEEDGEEGDGVAPSLGGAGDGHIVEEITQSGDAGRRLSSSDIAATIRPILSSKTDRCRHGFTEDDIVSAMFDLL